MTENVSGLVMGRWDHEAVLLLPTEGKEVRYELDDPPWGDDRTPPVGEPVDLISTTQKQQS